MPRVYAPWNDEQVESLNAFQMGGFMHPFTRRDRRVRGALVATKEGWIDPQSQEVCQQWAHDFMTDWGWLDTKLSIERFWTSDAARAFGEEWAAEDAGQTVEKEGGPQR